MSADPVEDGDEQVKRRERIRAFLSIRVEN
jgi:hypothetical protein